ncbi:Asp23/Gls24 family envelope stress response protein [Pseudonocardia kujensis]|uniref:Asp23/Gls24 family envelope stress response protein n=1 Tax=Pseudonocardia kujensis TaxID=1128675 RepID=UPI001E61C325|nr:Asp23/Gls24 family envelope stress response protein [Pseudonocardia kujensis]MCE0764348.1 Asp23/Gls24 family envelope stress response protein [Pseudonocardia kujensis]
MEVGRTVPGGRAETGPEDVRIEPLACGRDAADVWDHAAEGTLDAHERECPHCRAAAADALGLEDVVHRMAAERPVPPPSVLDGVMRAVVDTVTAELRPQDLLALDSPAGPARLSRAAAARVLRHVVDGMDGMRARSCRIEPVGSGPGGTNGADPFGVTVAITVTARFGVDLASVTARVRQMVVAAGEQALGVPVRSVDIAVVDLWDVP